MLYFTQPITMSAPFMRTVALTALMGAAMLLAPLTAAYADSASQSSASKHAAAMAAVETKAETVEQRISNLHASLKITPDEEANWNSVAQTMRDNAAKMEKLSADRTDKDPQHMSAIDDLKTYERFAHAHYDGLKDLISSFETLYNSMPDPQKHLADHVFQSFGREAAPARG